MSSTALRTAGRWLALAAAVLALNSAVTFHNVWPTLGITVRPELSIDLGVILLALVVWRSFAAALPRWVPYVLTALFFALALGRYAHVTAPALYGRPVNFYWDAQHLPAVVAMLAKVASPWLIAAGALAFVLGLAALTLGLHWCVLRVVRALDHTTMRRTLGGVATAAVAFYAVSNALEWSTRYWYSIPVSATYKQQITFLLEAFAPGTARELLVEPLPSSDLARVEGGDVVLMFLESYGAVAYDAEPIAAVVAPARAELAAAAADTGHELVSAFVRSPTFGGSSWFAHSTLMSGFEVRDASTYSLLLTQDRETLPARFAAAGYRAVAWMPGLRNAWPEGAFYGFDEILGERELAYRGPDFGWWRIPDQWALATLDARELAPQERRRVFAFFPTINTHIPFRPTPPVQPDWARLLGPDPFDPAEVAASVGNEPEWTNLRPAYADTLAYTYSYLASFLRARPDRDFVLILIGDHQPPASVSGQDARWDVPVHVITKRTDITAELRAAGFVDGIELPPHGAPLGSMRELTHVLLDAFDASEAGGTKGFAPMRESAP